MDRFRLRRQSNVVPVLVGGEDFEIAAGFTLGTGDFAPRMFKIDGRVFLIGGVTREANAASDGILIPEFPDGYRPHPLFATNGNWQVAGYDFTASVGSRDVTVKTYIELGDDPVTLHADGGEGGALVKFPTHRIVFALDGIEFIHE